MKQEFRTYIGHSIGFFIHKQCIKEYSLGILLDKEIALKINFGNKYILIGYIAKYEKD